MGEVVGMDGEEIDEANERAEVDSHETPLDGLRQVKLLRTDGPMKDRLLPSDDERTFQGHDGFTTLTNQVTTVAKWRD